MDPPEELKSIFEGERILLSDINNMLAINVTSESDVDIECQNILCWDTDGANIGVSQWIRNTKAVLLDTRNNQRLLSSETTVTRNRYYFLSPEPLGPFIFYEIQARRRASVAGDY